MGIRTPFIRLTDICQLSCEHCYASSGVKNPNELNTQQWAQALQKIAQHAPRVTLLGGEPTLLPNFRELLTYACKLYDDVTIQTNGINIPHKTLQHLEHEFGGPPSNLTIAISIEGNEELHESIRGKNTFEETIDSLKQYGIEYKGIKYEEDDDPAMRGYQTGIRITITKKLNPHQLPDLVKYFNEKLHSPVTLVRFLEKGRGTKKWTPSKKQLANLYQITQKLQNEGYTIDMFDSPYYAWDKDKREKYKEHFKNRGVCEVMRGERMNIEPDGTITPCFMLTDDEHEIGHILETPWNEIENKLTEFAEKQREKKLIEEPCQECEYSELCQGGCVYLNSDKRLDNRCPIEHLEVN
ncbi:hypothetical protein AKJ53_01720 [candidate division MSBL1 archaeon SCGC-AAA382F02]|uniref:Radical SAM core domain-containing protein n=1 Tax=candidate division MSBL1 archaeon SCGC-AAA382F02 TaxID=1698282 RepID=A0A133VHM3_9EURY|nr:hypothetical protein AKJ53_01720 [candidate division MSBL1 archaeon SCGC-AAA382F02]